MRGSWHQAAAVRTCCYFGQEHLQPRVALACASCRWRAHVFWYETSNAGERNRTIETLPGSGSHTRNRTQRCRSTSCGRMARSWAATSSRNSAISEMSGVVECLFRGTEVARRWHRMILVTNSPTTPCTFYFLSDRLVIRIIRLVGKHVGRDWKFVVGWRYIEFIRRNGPHSTKSRSPSLRGP